MPWPPRVGELLPRCDEPIGIEHKLRTYSLDIGNAKGWPKANGFLVMLGLDLTDISYIEREIRLGISQTSIATVRSKTSVGYNCTVQFQIAGSGRYSHRTANLRTVWQLTHPDARPRLVTAFLRGER
jgi:hypothetical protein